MLYEWMPDEDFRNYGDALGEIVVEALTEGLKSDGESPFDNPEVLYFPIGSVVDDSVISGALSLGLVPIFIGCGWRGNELTPELAKQAMYIGCRGPETQKALERAGILGVPIHGDTAYIAFDYLKLMPKKSGETLLVPHIQSENYNLEESGADYLLSLKVKVREDVIEIASRIGGAEFVLGGALHACITAHAFGVPFAPYTPNGIESVDVPEKWYDWLLSIGVARKDVEFVSSVERGKEWHKKVFFAT
jgi:hypothetical protein